MNTTTIEIPQAGPHLKKGMYNLPANEGWIAVSRFRTRTAVHHKDAFYGLLYALLHHAALEGYDFSRELKRACDGFTRETNKQNDDLERAFQELADSFAA